jgi:N-acetylmuramic acid 6-phosphate etherase
MTDIHELIRQLERLDTEKINPATVDIDRLPPLEIVRKINTEDKTVATVVETALPAIARAAETCAATLKSGGRVFLVGAGTSGRLGVLDAAECPPTFGTQPEQIVGVISGGYATLVQSREGVEDDRDAAARDLRERGLTANDFVIGVCASRRTPYTLAALVYAQSLGCLTAFIICNRAEGLDIQPDIVIELPVGPEVIAGSTRMKSGTAQKMALNMISTTAMVLLGKTYGNLMVDLECRSEKLAARSRRMVMDLLQVSLDEADDLLKRAGGKVKTAVAMKWLNCSKDEAEAKLRAVDGFISRLH